MAKKISELKVLKSNAGFYIGKTYESEHGNDYPYSRESGYYKTREEAQSALDNNNYSR